MEEPKQTNSDRPAPNFEASWAREPEPSTLPKMVGIAVVLVAVVVGLIFFLSPKPQPASVGAESHPYGEQLLFLELKMSEVENFAGGNVTYIEGKVVNNGDKTLKAATVESIFRNSLGEVVQTDKQNLKVFSDVGLYQDAVDVRNAPLQPKEARPFRLAYDRISADWNQQYPELRISSASVE